MIGALIWCFQHMWIILYHIKLLYYLDVHFASVNLSNPLLYFISSLYTVLTYISNTLCTTCLIYLYSIIITIIIIFRSVNIYVHYL